MIIFYKTEKQLFRIIIMMMDPRGKWQVLRSEVVGGDSFTTWSIVRSSRAMYIHNRVIDGWIEFIRQEGHGGWVGGCLTMGLLCWWNLLDPPSCIIWWMVCDAETTIEWFLASLFNSPELNWATAMTICYSANRQRTSITSTIGMWALIKWKRGAGGMDGPKVCKIGQIYQSVIDRFYTMINGGRCGKTEQYALRQNGSGKDGKEGVLEKKWQKKLCTMGYLVNGEETRILQIPSTDYIAFRCNQRRGLNGIILAGIRVSRYIYLQRRWDPGHRRRMMAKEVWQRKNSLCVQK